MAAEVEAAEVEGAVAGSFSFQADNFQICHMQFEGS